jgi:hypothetical protein
MYLRVGVPAPRPALGTHIADPWLPVASAETVNRVAELLHAIYIALLVIVFLLGAIFSAIVAGNWRRPR